MNRAFLCFLSIFFYPPVGIPLGAFARNGSLELYPMDNEKCLRHKLSKPWWTAMELSLAGYFFPALDLLPQLKGHVSRSWTGKRQPVGSLKVSLLRRNSKVYSEPHRLAVYPREFQSQPCPRAYGAKHNGYRRTSHKLAARELNGMYPCKDFIQVSWGDDHLLAQRYIHAVLVALDPLRPLDRCLHRSPNA